MLSPTILRNRFCLKAFFSYGFGSEAGIMLFLLNSGFFGHEVSKERFSRALTKGWSELSEWK